MDRGHKVEYLPCALLMSTQCRSAMKCEGYLLGDSRQGCTVLKKKIVEEKYFPLDVVTSE